MYRYSLIPLALISFSIASNAAAIPMDADQAMLGAIQNAALYKEVMLVQGGDSDKDVVEVLIVVIMDDCQVGWSCSQNEIQDDAIDNLLFYQHYLVSNGLVQTGPSVLQPLIVLLLLLFCVVFFIFDKSTSEK